MHVGQQGRLYCTLVLEYSILSSSIAVARLLLARVKNEGACLLASGCPRARTIIRERASSGSSTVDRGRRWCEKRSKAAKTITADPSPAPDQIGTLASSTKLRLAPSRQSLSQSHQSRFIGISYVSVAALSSHRFRSAGRSLEFSCNDLFLLETIETIYLCLLRGRRALLGKIDKYYAARFRIACFVQ